MRPISVYGSECLAVMKQKIDKMCVAEMRMFISENIRKDRI